MTVDRFLCRDCEQNLKDAQLVYKKIPGTENADRCEWCKARRYGAKYRIKYGRR